MTKTATVSRPTHTIIQLHGGGATVVAGLVKAAILEGMTGKRFHEIADTVIADSGGAIIALCLEKMPAKELLPIFINMLDQTLPGKGFYLTQPFSRKKDARAVNNEALRRNIESILGNKTINDYPSNLFVGAHTVTKGALTFEKIRKPDGSVIYNNTTPNTLLSSIAIQSATIPGVYGDNTDEVIDAIINQNPSSIISQMKDIYPDTDIRFIQVGNIEEANLWEELQKKSAIISLLRLRYAKYQVQNLHQCQIRDSLRMLPPDKVHSLISYAEGRFSPTNASQRQATSIVVKTLLDVEKRETEYTDLAQKLIKSDSDDPAPIRPVQDVIAEIKTILDPHMKKQRVYISSTTEITPQFPTPIYINATESALYKPAFKLGKTAAYIAPTFSRHAGDYLDNFGYKTGYAAGKLLGFTSPRFCEYLIDSDFNLKTAFHLAWVSGLRRMNMGPIETKREGTNPSPANSNDLN